MMKVFIAFKFTRAYPEKGDTVAVFGIEVGMYLKNKTAHFFLFHIYRPYRGFTAPGCGSDTDKCVEHFLYPKIVDRTAKKYRRHFSFQVIVDPEFAVYTIHQFHIFA